MKVSIYYILYTIFFSFFASNNILMLRTFLSISFAGIWHPVVYSLYFPFHLCLRITTNHQQWTLVTTQVMRYKLAAQGLRSVYYKNYDAASRDTRMISESRSTILLVSTRQVAVKPQQIKITTRLLSFRLARSAAWSSQRTRGRRHTLLDAAAYRYIRCDLISANAKFHASTIVKSNNLIIIIHNNNFNIREYIYWKFY